MRSAGGGLLSQDVMDADEIKALVGACDGLIAGRMHISIAALGSGVPVFGLVYQGKFEGLWQHFSLPKEALLNPKAFLETPDKVVSSIGHFLDMIPELKQKIEQSLPKVLTLSKENFQGNFNAGAQRR